MSENIEYLLTEILKELTELKVAAKRFEEFVLEVSPSEAKDEISELEAQL